MYSIIAIDTNSFKANLLRYASLLVLLMCIGVVQAQVPGGPTNLVATGINTGGMIQFTAPDDGGSAITNYEYSTDNGATWVTPSPAVTTSPLIISSGLTNCTSYQIKIRAVNSVGSGTASIAATLVPSTSNIGVNWAQRTSAAGNFWRSITYGYGLFVAVATSGAGNRVMTSPDGITWTARTSAADNSWNNVTYGNGLFVAVSSTGAGNRVMTSSDGITWTIRTSAADNQWRSVIYGNGLFVAVASSGTGNRVMTSPDGITWTIRTSAADNSWSSVTYGSGLFVAVANSGAGNQVMTSPDGITWTAGTSAVDNGWNSVTYGNGRFVAVASTGTNNRVMTSVDGITWNARNAATENSWTSVTYGNGLFVAVSIDGTGNRVMTSVDGETWTSRTSAANSLWFGVTYGNGVFVAVAGADVMTSGYDVVTDAPVISSATLGSTSTVDFTQSSSALSPAITNYEYSTDNGSNWVAVSPAATTSPLTINGLATIPSSIMIRALNSVGSSCPSNNYSSCTPTSSTETISACNSYTWHGTLYTASNNIATWTGVNAEGCDSLVTLNLTITTQPTNFTSGGINYVVTSPTTVAVGVNASATGVIVIPATVTTACGTYAVTSINNSAFQSRSGLTSVTIPNSITSIGMGAFASCSALTSIILPNSVTSIGIYAFTGCSGLTSVSLPNAITRISDGIFNGCSQLSSITIPNSVTSIGNQVFQNCTRLTSVAIPNTVTSIGNQVFQYCSGLTSVSISNSVPSIGNQFFQFCTSLTSVTIPNSVTSIGQYAFQGCSSLGSVTLSNSLTSIGSGAFNSCGGLSTITIPNTVTSIGTFAFVSCTGLTSIICNVISPITIAANVFQSVNQAACSLTVPNASVAAYQAAVVWQNFAPITDMSTLPVRLSSFTAKPTPDNKVSLAWVTSTEQVNKGFRIERQAGSVNGKFEQVGFVGSKAKDGNSQNTLTYSFIDAKPAIGIASFYRLVQEDLDGKLTYSEVRMVKLNGESVSVVFPNPSNGLVNISRTADGKKMNIQVTDQSGKIIFKAKNITEPNYTINIPQSGVYTIKMIYPETGEQSIQRVVVQK